MAGYSMKKLVATGAVITLIGTTGVYFASKNDQIQDRITKLFNVAGNYKAELANAQKDLNAKNDILAGLREMLNLDENATLDDFKNAINSKASSESTADVQALLNKIATEKLGLPATSGDGSTINYTQDEVLNEIYTLHDEVTELENYINNYVEEGVMDGTPYEGMTLLEKVQSMIDQLTQASKEDEAQLKLANDKLVALGYCPVHGSKFNSNGRCDTSGCEYARVEDVDDNGQSGDMTLPGGNTGGTGGTENPVNPPAGGTPVTPVEPEEPEGGTGGIDSAKLAEFEQALRDNATKGITNKTINALVNDHDNYRLHANGYVVKKQADGTWVYDSEHSANIPTKGSTQWTNIKKAYIAVFGEADLIK